MSKVVARKCEESLIVLALIEDMVNVWQVFPSEMTQKSGIAPNKIIDISSGFQGKFKSLSLPSETTCVIGAVDSEGRLAQVQITHLLRNSVCTPHFKPNSLGCEVLYTRRFIEKAIPSSFIRRETGIQAEEEERV